MFSAVLFGQENQEGPIPDWHSYIRQDMDIWLEFREWKKKTEKYSAKMGVNDDHPTDRYMTWYVWAEINYPGWVADKGRTGMQRVWQKNATGN